MNSIKKLFKVLLPLGKKRRISAALLVVVAVLRGMFPNLPLGELIQGALVDMINNAGIEEAALAVAYAYGVYDAALREAPEEK